jgi:hypothetical protein
MSWLFGGKFKERQPEALSLEDWQEIEPPYDGEGRRLVPGRTG